MQTPSGIRETRQHAREVKFLVPRELAPEIKDWATRHLDPDAHGSGPSGDEYRITSLYCDSAGLDVFHRRGSFGRAKYRVRRYGQLPTVFLERKLRTERLLSKRRTLVPGADLARLGLDQPETGWIGEWFHERVRLRRLAPTCQVSYRRTARVGQSEAGLMRLTVDDDLRGVLTAGFQFDGSKGPQLLSHHVIVELKFTQEMPHLFRLFIERFQIEPAALSKYRLALSTLRNLPSGREAVQEALRMPAATTPTGNRDILVPQCSPTDPQPAGRATLVTS